MRAGRLSQSVSGLARVRPPAGGETTVTAPVDGVLQASAEARAWPFVGLRVAARAPLFQVIPRIAADRSLSALESELESLEVERKTAAVRLSRLQELLALEATSHREVEEAQALVETLEAKHSALLRDLETARSSRQGGTAGGLVIRAPFGGEIAAIRGSQGTTVAAGEALARLVRTDRAWLEVALSPLDARRVSEGGVAGVVLADGESTPLRIEEGEVHLVAVGPELEPRTGTVTVLLEVSPTAGLTLGTALDAQVLLRESLEGIVVPASAVVDDGGVAIVYLQLSGESFARLEVDVLQRAGDRWLVDGLVAGQRLVSRGGEAIRRASLMASGEAQGHVH